MSSDAREGRIDYVELPAPTPEAFAAAKKFYGDVFGWSFQDWGDEYSDTRSSGVGCGLSSAPDHRPAGILAVVFCADLEGARERAIAAGGNIVKDIFAFPGGRRFEFLDPSGNRLGVWSDK